MSREDREQGETFPDDDELSLGDGRLEDDPEPMVTGEPEEPLATSLSDVFNGDYQDVLLDADSQVGAVLRELVNACWYSSALLVVRQTVTDNQPLFDEWVQDHIGEDFDVVTIGADLLMTPDEMLGEILDELELDAGEGSPDDVLLAALNRPEGGVEQERPRELVIQIENAHELGERVLHRLFSLVAGHETMITPHVILWWGDRVVQDNLAEWDPANVRHLDVPPFSREAVSEYLHYCWGQYSSEELPLDDEQVDEIMTASGGSADAIDKLALGELRAESAPVSAGWRKWVPQGLPRRHGLIAGLLVVVLAVIVMLRGGPDSGAGDSNIVRLDRNLPDNGPEQNEAVSADIEAASTAGREQAVPSADITDPDEAPGEEIVEPDAATGQAVADNVPAAQPEPARESVDTGADRADTGSSTTVSSPEPENAPTGLEQVADDRFFIQLLGSHDAEAASQFISSHAGLNNGSVSLHRFEGRYQSRPWHVVILGPYRDRSTAEDALAQLPRALQSASPWIRSMADIRSAMIP